MAAADTAKLIASLVLKDAFSGPLKNATKALAGFDAKLKDTDSTGTKIGKGIGTGIRNGLKIATVAIGLLATQVVVGLNQLVQLEAQTAQTNAAIVSTKGVAGQTADSIRNLAEKYENLNAVIDDKVIQSGANVLLTFTNIRKEAFEPAIAAALDLSVAMGQDLQSSIVQIGKALNDPARGFTALRRVGIQFTADQEKQIKALQESGDLLGAQKVILQELGTEFGGRFAAQGRSAQGTIAGIGDAVEDLQKGLATALFPTVQRLLPQFREALASPAFASAVSNLGDKISTLFSESNIQEGTRALGSLFKIAKDAAPAIQNAAEITGRVIKQAVDLFRSLPPEIQALAVAGLAINKLTGGLVTNLAGGLISAVLSSFKGMMHVNAGVVQVTGAAGAGMPVTPAGATGWASLFALIGPAVVAAIAAKEVTDATNREFSAAGIKTNFMAPGSGNLPFGIEASLNNIGEIFRISQRKLSGAIDNTAADLRTADRHIGDMVEGIDNTSADLRNADRHITDAVDANTSAARLGFRQVSAAQAKSIIEADRIARGIRDTGPSTSLAPRIRFLAGNAPGAKDVAVGNAIVTGFERGVTPLFRKTSEIPKAIKALQANQRQLAKAGDTKNAAITGGYIDRLKAELGRRQAATTAAVKAQKLTTTIPIAVSTIANTILNGRLFDSNLNRYSTVYSSATSIGGRGPR